ncbi:MAG: SDR family NAD(P)-dependent oxidoreductase [Fibrobacterota bacterium]|nr:SDR family NAD(P)-dependent oxidoreductase [Fibrobacterota bacterium]
MQQTVFITGVSSGLGLGLTKAYLDDGARVYGLSRREPKGLSDRSGFHFASVDLSGLEQIAPAVERLLEGVPRIDVAILNAGVLGEIGDMGETPLERMRRIMDVNLWANKPVLDAVFSGNREVTQVVAISSGAAVSGSRGWNGYSLSKAALNMMMKLYAAERPGTHFSALAPGIVDTAMQAHMRALPADPRFPTVDRLKMAAGTPDMPEPDSLAPRMLEAFERLMGLKSGEFHDIRSIH